MSRLCDFTGKGVQVGNIVSHANNKTKRRYLPNMRVATLVSETLGHAVQVRLSANALRTIEFKGGLDAFLSDARASNLSGKALKLKRQIAKAAAKKALSA